MPVGAGRTAPGEHRGRARTHCLPMTSSLAGAASGGRARPPRRLRRGIRARPAMPAPMRRRRWHRPCGRRRRAAAAGCRCGRAARHGDHPRRRRRRRSRRSRPAKACWRPVPTLHAAQSCCRRAAASATCSSHCSQPRALRRAASARRACACVRARAEHDAIIDAAIGAVAGAIEAEGGIASSGSRTQRLQAGIDAADGADAVIVIGGTGSGKQRRHGAHARRRRRAASCTGSRLIPARDRGIRTGGRASGAGFAGPARRGADGLASARPRHADAGSRRAASRCRAAPPGSPTSCPRRWPCRAGAGALRRRARHSHSLGLFAALGARAGRRMDLGAAGERRISGAQRGRDKTVAMNARFETKSAEHDLLAADPPRCAPGAIPRSGLGRGSARAFRAASSICRRCPAESVALADALGRVLAHDVIAPIDVPPFDRANVDGFALRAADTRGRERRCAAPTSSQWRGDRMRACAGARGRAPARRPPSRPAAWSRAAPMPW